MKINKSNNTTLARQTQHVEPEPPATDLMELPPWLKAMREAMADSIKPDDLAGIMQKQVEKAKGGDVKAANFVMNQAHKLMAAEQKKVTIIQNNYYDTPAENRPDTPAAAAPGTDAQIQKLQARVAARLPLKRSGDAGQRDDLRIDDDEAEKEMRRRLAAETEDAA